LPGRGSSAWHGGGAVASTGAEPRPLSPPARKEERRKIKERKKKKKEEERKGKKGKRKI